MELVFKVYPAKCGHIPCWVWELFDGPKRITGAPFFRISRLECVEEIGEFIDAVDGATIRIED